MPVVYGPSVPPQLGGHTLGEVRLRIEKIMFDVLLGDLSEWEAEACVVEPHWWGQEGRSTIRCAPATATTARHPTTIVFPCKTTRAQMEQYLAHSDEGTQPGLSLRIVVPSAASGKKRDLVVGIAAIRLQKLAPNSPVDGWFSIAGTNSSHMDCIGRVKAHISVTYFEAPRSRSGRGQKRVQINTDQISTDEILVDDRVVKEADSSSKMIPSHAANDATAAGVISNAAADMQKASQDAANHDMAAAAPSVPHRNDETSIIPTLDARRDAERLAAIIQRGLNIRTAMSSATMSHGSLTKAPDSLISAAFHVTSSASNLHPQPPSLVDHIRFVPADGDDSCSVSSEDDPVSDTTTEGEHSDRDEVPIRNGSPPYVAPGNVFSVNKQSTTRQGQDRFVQPTRIRVRLGGLALAARHFAACQIGLRVSRDVLFFNPPTEPIWSPLMQLPMGSASGCFQLDIASFTASSKLVLELYGITSDHQIALVGICIVPLYAQRIEAAPFRSPALGTSEAQCRLVVELEALPATSEHKEHMTVPTKNVIPEVNSSNQKHVGGSSYHCVPESAPVPPTSLSSSSVPRPSNCAPVSATYHASPKEKAHDTSPEVERAVVPSVALTESKLRMQLSVLDIRGIDLVRIGMQTFRDVVIIVALSGFRDDNSAAITSWKCDFDSFVGLRPKAEPPLTFHSTIDFGDIDRLRIAHVDLIVLAWVPDSRVPPPNCGHCVTSHDLLDGCLEIGTVHIDLRPHLKYGVPVLSGWYHINGVLGSAGQIRVECVSLSPF